MMQYACRVLSPSDVDLQIVQAMLQVKTDNLDFFRNFFRFQIIGARLAYWRLCISAACILNVQGLIARVGVADGLLAATAIIRISSSLERSDLSWRSGG
jgi:hypothetical protein